jgi:hypothetical protein
MAMLLHGRNFHSDFSLNQRGISVPSIQLGVEKLTKLHSRLDSWTSAEDKRLVDTVFSFASQRKPLLRAFEHFSDQSYGNGRKFRTPTAVGFRWNKHLSPEYYKELQKIRRRAKGGHKVEYVPVNEPKPELKPEPKAEGATIKELSVFTRGELLFLSHIASKGLTRVKQERGIGGTISDKEVLLYSINTKLDDLLSLRKTPNDPSK